VPHLYEVLKEKEIGIARLRQEIDALRLVCPLLHDDGDFTPSSVKVGDNASQMPSQDNIRITLTADEKEACLARIRARLGDADQKSVVPAGARNALLQFRQAAMGASRALLKRVPPSRFPDIAPHRRSFRSLFERLGRSSAA